MQPFHKIKRKSAINLDPWQAAAILWLSCMPLLVLLAYESICYFILKKVAAPHVIRILVCTLIAAPVPYMLVAGLRGGTLHYLARTNGFCEMEKLLARGVRANSKTLLKVTPLHLASRRRSLQCIEVLLANGADSHAKDWRGRTPLDYARSLGWEEGARAIEARY